MKNFTLLIFALFFTHLVYSQDIIVTKEQNSEWILNFQNENLKGRIKLFKNRILNDQNVYKTSGNPHGVKEQEGYNATTIYRPIYMFTSENMKPVIMSANPSEETINSLTPLLNERKIQSINFSNEIIDQALYGSRANNGIIRINVSKKEFKEIKDIIL
ncbi:hypothetical protein LB465_15475 [Salegentibacter sp. LM13S]|uniref:hypothetical protein n=1 Tax=Salegentibacter lacus TaxID=2873599 RepID=UPI001CCEB2CB|nr:hypothetical protein [Salegentibacter lacus]MBZ9632182.1 hypothetical protein [Salegentibacter lacus]